VSEEASLAELVREVKSLKHATQDELAEALGVAKGTISKWRRKAIAAGLISEGEWAGCLRMACEAAAEEGREVVTLVDPLAELEG
jgi:transcriptional regulator with XRE-family HTH domain